MHRLSHIDCLRCLAASLVMIVHLIDLVPDAQNSFIISTFMAIHSYVDFGVMGVYLFFIVSGYVISQSIVVHTQDNTKKFVISRIFRLYPAYWLALFFGVMQYGDTNDVSVYLTNVTMMQQFMGVHPIYSLFWTLSVELVFYALCVIFYKLKIIQNINLLSFIFVAISAYAAFSAIIRYFLDIIIPFGWPMWISLFVGGAILRRIDIDKPLKLGRFYLMGIFYIVCILIISYGIWHNPEDYTRSWYQRFFSLTIAASIFVFTNYIWPIRSKFGAYLGRISYSTYLLHMPVGAFCLYILAKIDANIVLPPILLLGIMVTSTILISAISFRFIENPSIKAGKIFTTWLTNKGN